MRKKKPITDPSKPAEQIPEHTLPPAIIAQPLSQAAVQAQLYAFSNLDKHAGIEEMSMAALDLPSTSFLTRLGNDLLLYADLPSSTSFQAYFNKHNIFTSYVYEWMEKNKYFKNCCLLAKEKIGVRREQFGLFGEDSANAPSIIKTMPIYSHEYKWLEEWKSELSAKAKVTPEPSKITFVIDRRTNEQQHSSGTDHGPDMRTSMGDQSTDREAGTKAEGSGQPEESV